MSTLREGTLCTCRELYIYVHVNTYIIIYYININIILNNIEIIDEINQSCSHRTEAGSRIYFEGLVTENRCTMINLSATHKT